MKTPSTKKISSRACDTCRRRKVKCDGALPKCSNCRSEAQCSFDLPSGKRGPRKKTPADMTPQSMQDHPTPSTATEDIGPSPPPPEAVQVERDQARQLPSIANIISSPAVYSGPSCGPVVEAQWSRLLSTLSETLPGQPLQGLFEQCLDVYMRWLFPITPLVHEPSVRAFIRALFSTDRAASTPSGSIYDAPTARNIGGSDFDPRSPLSLARISECSLEPVTRPIDLQRKLAYLTALCAIVCWQAPKGVFTTGRKIAETLLQASQNMAKEFYDADIADPCAASVIIRYWHTNCTHNASKARLSWHYLGESIRLAQAMRLHDEQSLQQLNPIEAQLRRTVFWQLYAGDISASLLNNRPITMHSRMLDTPLTLLDLSAEDVRLLDYTRSYNTLQFARYLNTGFMLCKELFSRAGNLLLDLKSLLDYSMRPSTPPMLVSGLQQAIIDSFLSFQSLLDNVPAWLKRPDEVVIDLARDDVMHQRHALWIQHVNIEVTYNCLQLNILQKARHLGFASLLGYSDDYRLTALRETEIAREVLDCLRSVPFEALQANGEPLTEKIRQVGATLLQISHNVDNNHVATRARHDLESLIHILSRLDSKVSETLYNEIAAAGRIE